MSSSLQAIYAEVLRAPRDDGPRLAYATAIESHDAARAEYIRLEVGFVRRLCAGLLAEINDGGGHYSSDGDHIKERHIARWEDEAGVPARLRKLERSSRVWDRGFVEYATINLTAPDRDEMIGCLDRFPILHLGVGSIGTKPLPSAIATRIPAMATLAVGFADDEAALTFLSSYDLRGVRDLGVSGNLSEKVLHAICQADLPGLESFGFYSPQVPNPVDESISFEWTCAHTHTVVHPLSIELEKRYGWKKYFHVASRFTVFPYYTSAIFDILPPMPPEPSAWDRTLDGVTLKWDPACLKPH